MSKDKYEKRDEQVVPQTQDQQPGIEAEMNPLPIYDDENYKGSGKLKGKNCLDYRWRQWNRTSCRGCVCERGSECGDRLFGRGRRCRCE